MYFLPILLLLSSSSHVCNARHLHDHHGKDIEDLKHDRTLTPLKPVQSLSSGLHSQKHQPMNGKDGVHERVGSATTKDARDTEALPRDVKAKSGSVSGAVQIGSLVTVSWRIPPAKHGVHPGNKNLMPYTDVDLRQKTKLEETGRRWRSILGFGSDVKESIESDVTDVDQDVVSMDYQQPHLNPPIHNP
ncbi:hypothetical protein CKAN_01889000 [Cinnamomum micranthum f. kanehirae]|uniref:Uncharacterized protein n=1 Tax=Cinnamomum micranthum f. kanehirae TaxID=337451 RepID=A0A443PGC8_9MAGN|nr:hypothetical protein CKAN_01889000 [Cinnamomum micranthum f. kanehirae]